MKRKHRYPREMRERHQLNGALRCLRALTVASAGASRAMGQLAVALSYVRADLALLRKRAEIDAH